MRLHFHLMIGLVLTTMFLALFGCSDTDSNNVTTDGLSADIYVRADGTGLTAILVDLSVGSGGLFSTDVELSDGDTLTATDGTETRTLVKTDYLGFLSYVTRFDTEAEDTEFTISLTRNNDTDAEHSVVSLPAPFDLFVSPVNLTGDGNDSVTVTWSPAAKDDTLVLWVNTACSKTVDGEFADSYFVESHALTDDGEEVFSLGTLTDVPDFTVFDHGCDIDMDMERIRTGLLDPAFGEGGSIEAMQVREKTIHYMP